LFELDTSSYFRRKGDTLIRDVKAYWNVLANEDTSAEKY